MKRCSKNAYGGIALHENSVDILNTSIWRPGYEKNVTIASLVDKNGFSESTSTISQLINLTNYIFGHAGDGNLHIYICRDGKEEKEWLEKEEKAFELMYKKSREFGGLVSGEHGIGLDKRPYLRELLGDDQLELMKGIKQVFDPNGILNPGKVI